MRRRESRCRRKKRRCDAGPGPQTQHEAAALPGRQVLDSARTRAPFDGRAATLTLRPASPTPTPLVRRAGEHGRRAKRDSERRTAAVARRSNAKRSAPPPRTRAEDKSPLPGPALSRNEEAGVGTSARGTFGTTPTVPRAVSLRAVLASVALPRTVLAVDPLRCGFGRGHLRRHWLPSAWRELDAALPPRRCLRRGKPKCRRQGREARRSASPCRRLRRGAWSAGRYSSPHRRGDRRSRRPPGRRARRSRSRTWPPCGSPFGGRPRRLVVEAQRQVDPGRRRLGAGFVAQPEVEGPGAVARDVNPDSATIPARRVSTPMS